MRPLSSTGEPVRISADGGISPEWRADGRELFYMRPDGSILAVPVAGPSGLGEPKVLFQTKRWQDVESFGVFDVTTDGQRFLILERGGPPPPLTLIQNWTALLER